MAKREQVAQEEKLELVKAAAVVVVVGIIRQIQVAMVVIA